MTLSSYSFFSSAPCLISALYNSSTKAPLKWFIFICVQQYTRSRILPSDTGYIVKRKEDLSCPGIFVVWDVISIAEWLGSNTLTIFNGSHNAKFKGQFSAFATLMLLVTLFLPVTFGGNALLVFLPSYCSYVFYWAFLWWTEALVCFFFLFLSHPPFPLFPAPMHRLRAGTNVCTEVKALKKGESHLVTAYHIGQCQVTGHLSHGIRHF